MIDLFDGEELTWTEFLIMIPLIPILIFSMVYLKFIELILGDKCK